MGLWLELGGQAPSLAIFASRAAHMPRSQKWYMMFFMIMTDTLHPVPMPNSPLDFLSQGYYNDEPLIAF
jgi:hypothetical protein